MNQFEAHATLPSNIDQLFFTMGHHQVLLQEHWRLRLVVTEATCN